MSTACLPPMPLAAVCADVEAYHTGPHHPSYAASKYALRGFSHSCYELLRDKGVKVGGWHHMRDDRPCMVCARCDLEALSRGIVAVLLLPATVQRCKLASQWPSMLAIYMNPKYFILYEPQIFLSVLVCLRQVVEIAPGNVAHTGMAEKSDMHGRCHAAAPFPLSCILAVAASEPLPSTPALSQC
jgi:hypothetical protein